MTPGRVMAASQSGAYVLRLVGDVRMTLCTSLDDYISHMLEDPDFASVWIDLCDVEGLDSTTLGQLARLAQRVHASYGFRPAIYSCDAGINRLLHSMAFHRLFDLHEDACKDTLTAVEDIPLVPGSEEVVKDRVIEAHRALMGVSDENAERFKDLMLVLETS